MDLSSISSFPVALEATVATSGEIQVLDQRKDDCAIPHSIDLLLLQHLKYVGFNFNVVVVVVVVVVGILGC